MHNYKSMRVWQKSMELARRIYLLSEQLPM